MLDAETKRHIDNARDVLVGKVPDPKAQIEMITIALIYKFMDDMDKASVEMGGKPSFFTGQYKEYTWTKLMDIKMSGVQRIKLYSEALEKMPENKGLPQLFRDILKDAFLPFRDPETLNLFLKEIAWFNYDHSENLGDAFEYLLSIMSSQGDAGQFRTPRQIIDFMVEVIAPQKNETILDPACGTAGFLISAYNHILNKNTKKNRGDKLTPEDRKKLAGNIVGYDISPDMVRLSRVNMYLHGFTSPRIFEYDTLTNEERWNDNFDVILANPPFMTPKGGIRPHKKFAIQANRSEVLFVDYFMEHINLKGRAAVIVPEGIIFQSANAYKALRKKLVEENYLWAVVSLPAGIFSPYSGVKTSILFMDKEIAKKVKDVLFVKVSNDGFDLGAQRREIAENDLPTAAESMKSYIENVEKGLALSRRVKKSAICEIVPRVKLAENGEYNLTGDRHKLTEVRGNQKWPIVKLGDVCEISAGNSAPQDESFFKDGKYPFFRTSDVGNVHISDNLTNSRDKLNDNGIKGLTKFKKGTILFPKSGASTFLNHRAILGVDGYVSSHLATIYTDINKAIPEFIFRLLNTIDAKTLTSDQNYPSLKLSDVSKIKIPLPPLEIQRKIVAEIEGYQKIIDGARMVADNWKPRIDIDPSWPKVKLGETCKVISGYSFDSKEFSSGNPIKCIKITNVGVQNFVSDDSEKLPEKFLNKCPDFIANSGDIVISLTRSIISGGLKVARVPSEWDNSLVNQRVGAIKPNNACNLDYIYSILCSEDTFKYIEEKSKSLMQPNLSINDLKAMLIPLPPLELQRKISERILAEQKSVDSCREMIKIYEGKIKQVIDKVWK